MSNNINPNLFSAQLIDSKALSSKKAEPIKESVNEPNADAEKLPEEAKDSISISNRNGTSSVSYDFSNYNQRNSLADA